MKFVAIAALIATTQAVEGMADASMRCDGDSVMNPNEYCETEVGMGSCCITMDTADMDVGMCTTMAGAGDMMAPATTLTCAEDMMDSANKLVAAGVSLFLAAALCM